VDLPATITRRTDQGHSIEHGIAQDTSHDHDQDDSTGPPLLVELVELSIGSSTAPCQDTSHDHDQDSSTGPASLVDLPATITRRTDQGRSIEHGTGQDTSHDHDQDDNAGPLLLVKLVELVSTTPAKATTATTAKTTAPGRLRW
jgi:hypothetical protein